MEQFDRVHPSRSTMKVVMEEVASRVNRGEVGAEDANVQGFQRFSDS